MIFKKKKIYIILLLFISFISFAEIHGEFRIGKDLSDDIA